MATIVLALVILDRPRLAGVVGLAVIPVTSGLRTVGGSLRPSDAILVLLTLLVAVSSQRGPRPDRLDAAVGALTAGMVILPTIDGLLYGRSLNASGLLAPVQILLLYRLTRVTLDDVELRRRALRWFLLASLPVSALTIAQGVSFPGAQRLVAALTNAPIFATWGFVHYPRATGPFPIWHALAGYLMIVLLLAVALLAHRDRSVLSPTAMLATACPALIALVFSQTFTVLLVLIAATCFVLWRARAGTALAVLAVTGGVVFVLFGSVLSDRLDRQLTQSGPSSGTAVPQTIDYRFTVWTEQFLPKLSEFWVTGYGLDLPSGIDWQHTESAYITLWLRGGLPLLALHIGVMVQVFRQAGVAGRLSGPGEAPVATTVRTLVVALMIMNFVWPYSTNSGLLQPFWLLVGVAAAPLGREPARMSEVSSAMNAG